MELMRSPRSHPLSFRHKFASRYAPLIDRDFLLGRDPFEDAAYKPMINILRDQDHYQMEIALPGYKKEEISIHLQGNILTIKGKKSRESKPTSDYILKEYSSDHFERTFRLSSFAHENTIEATFKNGVLILKFDHGEKWDKNRIAKTIEID